MDLIKVQLGGYKNVVYYIVLVSASVCDLEVFEKRKETWPGRQIPFLVLDLRLWINRRGHHLERGKKNL